MTLLSLFRVKKTAGLPTGRRSRASLSAPVLQLQSFCVVDDSMLHVRGEMGRRSWPMALYVDGSMLSIVLLTCQPAIAAALAARA